MNARYLYRVVAFAAAVAVTWLVLYLLLDAQLLHVKLGEHGHVAVGTATFALIRSVSSWGESQWFHVGRSRAHVRALLTEVIPKLDDHRSNDAIPWDRLRGALADLKALDPDHAREVGDALADVETHKQVAQYSAVRPGAEYAHLKRLGVVLGAKLKGDGLHA